MFLSGGLKALLICVVGRIQFIVLIFVGLGVISLLAVSSVSFLASRGHPHSLSHEPLSRLQRNSRSSPF